MDALSTLPGFRARYLELAGMLLGGYLGAGHLSAHAAPLTAQMALFFWLDDRLDAPPSAGSPDPTAIARCLREGTRSHGPETHAFGALDDALWALRADDAARTRWRHSLAAVVDAMAAEQLLARDPLAMGYCEYTAVGALTSTMPHLFVTLAWLGGEALRGALDEPTGDAVVRKLALHARLQNDLHSVERDRREGCAANAVLVLARELGHERALEHVQRELTALEAQLARVLALRPADCALRSLAPAILRSHARFYERAADRYGAVALKAP